MMSSPYGRYPAILALQHAAEKRAAIEAVSRAAPTVDGRPALRIIDGDLADLPAQPQRPAKLPL
jgi:hypothetical protein